VTVEARETAEVAISYVLAPAQPLPEGLKAIAVIDAGVETKGAKEDEREQKWSTMAADMIESMLASSATRFGSGIQVAQRRMTRQILAEKDLQLAGLVDGATAEKAGKLLAVQGLIASRITINMDVQTSKKSTLDWGGIMGAAAQSMLNRGRSSPPVVATPAPVIVQPGRPAYLRQNRGRSVRDPRTLRYRRYAYDPRLGAAPGPVMVSPPVPQPQPDPPVRAPAALGIGTKEVEEVSRHLTVQCSFTLIDAATGEAIAQYSPPPYQKVDTASPDFLFGSMQEAQLDPVDHFIGELVERGVQEFVSLLVPTEVEYRYQVVGRHSRAEAGVRALRADDLDTAFEQFQAELAKYKDAHEAVFALGVLTELRGQPEKALGYYRKAASMEDVDDGPLQMYLAAKKRVTDHLPRIMKSPAEGAPPSGALQAEQSGAKPAGAPPDGVFGFGTAGSPAPAPSPERGR
jgi:hypothetical protein